MKKLTIAILAATLVVPGVAFAKGAKSSSSAIVLPLPGKATIPVGPQPTKKLVPWKQHGNNPNRLHRR